MSDDFHFPVTLDPGESVIVYGKRLTIIDQGRSFIEIEAGVRPVPPPPPPPPPSGDVVWFCDFTPEQFAEWQQDPPAPPELFEIGDGKSKTTDTAPGGVDTTLRMKLAGVPGPGNFPPGVSASFRLQLPALAPGLYEFDYSQVQHDLGTFAIELDGVEGNLLEVYGYEADFGGTAWETFGHPFQVLAEDGALTLTVYYTAPVSLAQHSGVKVTGLKVRRVG